MSSTLSRPVTEAQTRTEQPRAGSCCCGGSGAAPEEAGQDQQCHEPAVTEPKRAAPDGASPTGRYWHG